jgi:hypothetical protein
VFCDHHRTSSTGPLVLKCESFALQQLTLLHATDDYVCSLSYAAENQTLTAPHLRACSPFPVCDDGVTVRSNQSQLQQG